MKRVMMLFLAIGLFAMPTHLVGASTTPLAGDLMLTYNSDVFAGFMGIGDPDSWVLMTTPGNGGSFSMDSLVSTIQLSESDFIPTFGDNKGTITFTFGVVQDGFHYALNLYGPLVAGTEDTYQVTGDLDANPVPIPASLLLLASGLAGVAGIKKKGGFKFPRG